MSENDDKTKSELHSYLAAQHEVGTVEDEGHFTINTALLRKKFSECGLIGCDFMLRFVQAAVAAGSKRVSFDFGDLNATLVASIDSKSSYFKPQEVAKALVNPLLGSLPPALSNLAAAILGSEAHQVRVFFPKDEQEISISKKWEIKVAEGVQSDSSSDIEVEYKFVPLTPPNGQNRQVNETIMTDGNVDNKLGQGKLILKSSINSEYSLWQSFSRCPIEVIRKINGTYIETLSPRGLSSSLSTNALEQGRWYDAPVEFNEFNNSYYFPIVQEFGWTGSGMGVVPHYERPNFNKVDFCRHDFYSKLEYENNKPSLNPSYHLALYSPLFGANQAVLVKYGVVLGVIKIPGKWLGLKATINVDEAPTDLSGLKLLESSYISDTYSFIQSRLDSLLGSIPEHYSAIKDFARKCNPYDPSNALSQSSCFTIMVAVACLLYVGKLFSSGRPMPIVFEAVVQAIIFMLFIFTATYLVTFGPLNSVYVVIDKLSKKDRDGASWRQQKHAQNMMDYLNNRLDEIENPDDRLDLQAELNRERTLKQQRHL